MDELQKVTLTLSQNKSRLNALGMNDDLTPEQAIELEVLASEYQTLELRHQALLLASDPLTPAVADSESQELAQLETRAQLGGIIHSLLGGQQTVGAEAELQAYLQLPGNALPLSMLSTPGAIETRAVSTIGSDVARQQDPIVPYIFPQSSAAWLGIQMPTVPVGDASYPVLTGPAITATPAAGAIPVATGIDVLGFSTGAISTTNLTPGRLQAGFFFGREDRARLRGMESALRRNLNDALADGLDAYILADSTAGLLAAGLTPASDPSAATSYLGYQNSVFSQVDGRYAMMPSQIKLLWGSESMRHASTVYRSTDSDSGYESVMKNSGGARVSSHVPAADSTSHIQVALARKGEAPGAVAPIWDSVEIIVDNVTLASTGQIALTAILLFAFSVYRAAVFAPLKFQLA